MQCRGFEGPFHSVWMIDGDRDTVSNNTVLLYHVHVYGRGVGSLGSGTTGLLWESVGGSLLFLFLVRMELGQRKVHGDSPKAGLNFPGYCMNKSSVVLFPVESFLSVPWGHCMAGSVSIQSFHLFQPQIADSQLAWAGRQAGMPKEQGQCC